jgi:hypothetical protein
MISFIAHEGDDQVHLQMSVAASSAACCFCLGWHCEAALTQQPPGHTGCP